MKQKLISKDISEFNSLIEKVKSDYEYASSMILQLDQEYYQDIAHAFELDPVCEKNKIATRARTNRLDRRYYKDIAEEYEPLYKLVTDKANVKSFELLKQVLGQTRKSESYHEKRTYRPRVTKDNKIEKKIIR